eukprot:9111364-Pyramimonas_sp.AAC.1
MLSTAWQCEAVKSNVKQCSAKHCKARLSNAMLRFAMQSNVTQRRTRQSNAMTTQGNDKHGVAMRST